MISCRGFFNRGVGTTQALDRAGLTRALREKIVVPAGAMLGGIVVEVSRCASVLLVVLGRRGV